MNRLLWILQFVLALYFIAAGLIHFVVPEGLPTPMSWMYDLSPTVHALAGTAEILGGLGLILPGLTGIRPQLTIWAALGLALVMVFAAVWHVRRGELTNLVGNLVSAAALVFVAYGRAKVEPLPARRTA
jgi:putative oxidoreductase